MLTLTEKNRQADRESDKQRDKNRQTPEVIILIIGLISELLRSFEVT